MEPIKFINTTSEFIVEKAYQQGETIKSVSVNLVIRHLDKSFDIKPNNGNYKEFGFIQRSTHNVHMITAITRAIEEAAVFAERILNEEK